MELRWETCCTATRKCLLCMAAERARNLWTCNVLHVNDKNVSIQTVFSVPVSPVLLTCEHQTKSHGRDVIGFLKFGLT